MEISIFIFVLCSLIGVLGVLYCLHFRYRALVMGPQMLRNALSRTVTGDEDASDEDLRSGLQELESRFRRAVVVTLLLLVATLVPCATLFVSSTLPELAWPLAGLCILMAAILASLLLLRDIPRTLHRHLDGPSPI